ncbi:MAG: hypothetical protein AB7T06_22700 [Kofleriaceae bacterium]
MSNEAKSTPPKTPNTEAPFPSFAAFDPMQLWAQSQAQMQKMMSDATARWQSFADQYAQIEQQVSSHAQAAVTNWAQLAKDAIAYGVQLSAEARKLSLDTAKKLGINA